MVRSEGARGRRSEGAKERGGEGARGRGGEGARGRRGEGARGRGSEGARERGGEGARERGGEGARERGGEEAISSHSPTGVVNFPEVGHAWERWLNCRCCAHLLSRLMIAECRLSIVEVGVLPSQINNRQSPIDNQISANLRRLPQQSSKGSTTKLTRPVLPPLFTSREVAGCYNKAIVAVNCTGEMIR